MNRLFLAAAALVVLPGCDVATDVAGDVIAGEVRVQYLERCQGIAANAGVAADRIGAACECSADRFQEDFAADGQMDINPDRVEEVVRMCMQDDAQVAPVEG